MDRLPAFAETRFYPLTEGPATSTAAGKSKVNALGHCMKKALAIVLIGILVLIYMLLVKPAGTLTVTYEKRATANPA